MWIFYSNLILKENTVEAKISAKTRRNQPISRIEVATENRSYDRKFIMTEERGCDQDDQGHKRKRLRQRKCGRD